MPEKEYSFFIVFKLIVKIIASCPNLKKLNDKEIDVEERLAAVNKEGTKQQKKSIDFMRWDLVFATVEDLHGIQLISI